MVELESVVTNILKVERNIREAITDVQLGKADRLAVDDTALTQAWYDLLDSNDPFLSDARDVLSQAMDLLKTLRHRSKLDGADDTVMYGLQQLDKKYRNFAELWDLPEKSCTYSLRASRPPTLALVANDVAHCIHNIADVLASRASPDPVFHDDIYLQGVSEKDVEKIFDGRATPENAQQYYAVICREWSVAKRRFQYTPDGEDIAPGFELDDVEPTACYITPSGATLRLGSSSGHAAHVELADANDEQIKVRVTYYDPDKRVRRVLAGALESELSAKCWDFESDGKVICEYDDESLFFAPTKHTKALAATLSMMTSSDYRVHRQHAPYASYFSKMGEESEVFSAHFDNTYFPELSEDQRIFAETSFVRSAAKTFANKYH